MPALHRLLLQVLVLGAVLALTGCTSFFESPAQRRDDANSAAGKTGKAAHHVAVAAGKAADAAGRDLAKAARQAHAGWREAAREQKAKSTK